MRYFKNVKSYEDMKEQYKKLLKENHPDNGGNVEVMKEINVEYDSIFNIWKDRHNATASPEQQTTETADSTRSKFYTDFGWEGSNHDWSRSLKEIAVIVRGYVKEKYPTFKFSVRTSYASMCKELHISLTEAPFEIYKAVEEFTEDDINEIIKRANHNYDWSLSSWWPEEAKKEIQRLIDDGKSYCKIYRDDVAVMLEDVDNFVKSYNYSDCDGMQDYFHVDFYYFNCKPDNLKIVPKSARIKNKATAPTTKESKPTEPAQEQAEQIEQKDGYTYKITAGEDTRDGSALWIVRIEEKLERDEYIAENKAMKARGGYYSKFKHGFIFKFDPTEILTGKAE